MITITRAPPYLTVQNGGRKHSRSFGVPRGGAMDLFAIRAANALVGNSLDAAALEWALGGGTVRFDRDCVFAIGGAMARATISGRVVAPCTTTYARAGDEFTVEQITSGRFLYLACDGGIDVPVILGSRSTYLPGRFGGYQGRSLRSGDSVALGPPPGARPAEGFHSAADLMPRYDSAIVHITPTSQTDLFDESAWRTLTESDYRVSTASDRTGYKLDGPALRNSLGALPSEASCPGAIQIPGDGRPIALMADAPTVGGYPKIAVISEADLPILAQRRPGETIRFQLITIEQSQRALRRRASDMHTISQLASRSSLA
ncbi:MAG TPA: biotin-dependent carboxyltransferase family protein [Gemmatimonadaceae bacterium]|nr:biotin-dependent carboxyltransferase family protein [Gemmatimonadaceae bacterium]